MNSIAMPMKVDVIYYVGEVTRRGYQALSERLSRYKTGEATECYFVPITIGGDPHAAFRVARAIGHYYPGKVTVIIPSICKSAGTLMCIGGSELVICDTGELGPLDIQLSNREELGENSSGLDITTALVGLQSAALEAFKDYLLDLKIGGGLGTKIASDIACKLATGFVAPITGQIDPMKLGEHQRAMKIAIDYGNRLNEKFKNTDFERINRLSTVYPVHSFVIDRKEASELFNNVRAPNDLESMVLNHVNVDALDPYGQPIVGVYNLDRVINEVKEQVQTISGGEANDTCDERKSDVQANKRNKKSKQSDSRSERTD